MALGLSHMGNSVTLSFLAAIDVLDISSDMFAQNFIVHPIFSHLQICYPLCSHLGFTSANIQSLIAHQVKMIVMQRLIKVN